MQFEKKLKNDIKSVLKQYQPYIDEFNNVFSDQFNSNVKLVDTITKYIVKRKGKQFRPVLVLLSTLSCGGSIDKKVYQAASVVELLHTATLIHDDVVDEADKRRGFPTIQRIWKNKIAILIGDYLLAKSLIIATETGKLEMMNIIANVAKRMSKGELFQIEKARKLDISEDDYFNLINDKTSSLISASCHIGALMSDNGNTYVNQLKQYGELLGQAFQIQDDLLDYSGNSHILGKPVISDLMEKKITLPLIYAFNHLTESEVKKIKKNIKKGLSAKEAAYIIKTVHDTGGYSQAREKAEIIVNQACDQIKNLPASGHKESLINIAHFVINRNH